MHKHAHMISMYTDEISQTHCTHNSSRKTEHPSEALLATPSCQSLPTWLQATQMRCACS